MAKYCPYCVSRVDHGDKCPYCNYAATYKAKPHHLKPGTLLRNKRYLVGRVIGEGGFGITYVGRDLTLDMKVAIKEYFPTSMARRINTVSSYVSLVDNSFESSFKNGREQFIKEAQTLAELDKENAVVTVRDFFGDNDSAYIVMEFIEGEDLKTIIQKERRPVPAQDLLNLLEPVFSALTKAHEKGLIHRDISPDNLMIEDGRARLIDFGCARTLFGGAASETFLKHAFSPIEQYQNTNMGPWTDVYSMAATIYYCITGNLPPRATDRVIRDELVPPTNLGAKLSKKQERALMKALAVYPKDRYPSMQEFGRDLFVHKNKYKAVAIAACAVAAIAAGAFFLFKPTTVVETMATENVVTEILSLDDNLSKEEENVIRQVEDLVSSVEISRDSTYVTLSVVNNTEYSLDNVVFKLTYYDKDNAILGTSSGSVSEWKTQQTALPRMYCGVADPDHLSMKIYFDYKDKRYQTRLTPTNPFVSGGELVIELSNSLPESFAATGYNIKGEYTITSFEYKASQDGQGEYYVTFRIGGSYSGDDTSRTYNGIKFRILNADNALIESGGVSLPSLKDGERFENATFTAFNLKPGSYYVELLPGS